MKTYELKVSGMTCSGCEQRLTKALMQIEGVQQVSASAVSSKILVSVTDDFSQVQTLTDKIQAMGYDVDHVTPLKTTPHQTAGSQTAVWLA